MAVRTVERYPYGGIWFVESECEAGTQYTIVPTENGDTCECPDYRQRGGPCKHSLAVELYQRCERAQAEQADPRARGHGAPRRIPVDFDARPIPFELTPLGMLATADRH